MLLPKQLLVFLASIAQVGHDGQAQLFDLNCILLLLQEL